MQTALTTYFEGEVWFVGVALGLLCHAAFLLAFDVVAERRGAAYLAAIESHGRVRRAE
ncbi:MAG: hypothetical protein ABR499_22025 [Gemmatimonadaceae bacterium]